MRNVKNVLIDQVERHNTPSIQYMFFNTDSVAFELRHGWKNVQSKTPVDEATTYHLFSVTKTFTALAVLQLAQSGKVALNRSASEYLPDFPYSDRITVEQLLSHTSGIPNPLPLKWIHLAEERQQFNRDKFFADVFKKNHNLKFEPGTAFTYSNLGYVLLGQLIENSTGQSFEAYVKENIMERCGIHPVDLGFQINPSTHATGYHKWWSLGNALFGLLIDKKKFMGPREGRWKPFRPFYINGTAYGGMVGSATGLVQYAQALLRNDSVLLDPYYKKILFTEKIVRGKPTGMSFSWFTGSLKGNTYFAHAGGGGGYYVELRIYPDLGAGSVIMYNRSGMTDQRILDHTDQSFITKNGG